MPTLDQLLAQALRADPAGPFLTYYDDLTGERVELSLTTFSNWVAKTANLLVDELDLEPGEPVVIDLPPHWQTAVILVAVGVAGGSVDSTAGRVAFVAEGSVYPDVEHLVGLGLRPLGGGLVAPRRGVLDYGREVLTFGDTFAATAPAPTGDLQPIVDRLLTVSLEPLLPVLVGHGSLVICRNPAAERLAQRADTEKVSATWGVDIADLPRRD